MMSKKPEPLTSVAVAQPPFLKNNLKIYHTKGFVR